MQPKQRTGSGRLPDGEDFIENGTFLLDFEGCTGVYQKGRRKGTENSRSQYL